MRTVGKFAAFVGSGVLLLALAYPSPGEAACGNKRCWLGDETDPDPHCDFSLFFYNFCQDGPRICQEFPCTVELGPRDGGGVQTAASAVALPLCPDSGASDDLRMPEDPRESTTKLEVVSFTRVTPRT